MQSALFKLYYFWSSLVPSFSASGKDVWPWLDEDIDFGKWNLNILKYVNDKSLETNPSHPVCLFMWLRHIAPMLGPNPSFTSTVPAIQHVWLLSLNECRQTNSPSHSPLPFRSPFIHTFISQKCTEYLCARLGERETDYNAVLALKATRYVNRLS